MIDRNLYDRDGVGLCQVQAAYLVSNISKAWSSTELGTTQYMERRTMEQDIKAIKIERTNFSKLFSQD